MTYSELAKRLRQLADLIPTRQISQPARELARQLWREIASRVTTHDIREVDLPNGLKIRVGKRRSRRPLSPVQHFLRPAYELLKDLMEGDTPSSSTLTNIVAQLRVEMDGKPTIDAVLCGIAKGIESTISSSTLAPPAKDTNGRPLASQTHDTSPDGVYSATGIAKAMKVPDKADAIRKALHRLLKKDALPNSAWMQSRDPAKGQAKILFKLSAVRPHLARFEPAANG